jgi:hypothetical protein
MSATVAGTISRPDTGDQPKTSTALAARLTPCKDPAGPIHHPKSGRRSFRPTASYTNARDVTVESRFRVCVEPERCPEGPTNARAVTSYEPRKDERHRVLDLRRDDCRIVRAGDFRKPGTGPTLNVHYVAHAARPSE